MRKQFQLTRKIRKGILIPRKASRVQQSAEVDFVREMQTLNKTELWGKASPICTLSINNALPLCFCHRSSLEHPTPQDFALLCLWKQSVGGDRAANQAVRESPLVSWSKGTKNPWPTSGKRANSCSPRGIWDLGGSCFPQPSFSAPAAQNPSTG